MYKASIRALLRHSIDKLNHGDYSLLLKMASPDFELAFPGDNSWATMFRPLQRGRAPHVTHRGVDEAAAFAERFVDEGIQFEIEDILVNGPPWNTRIALRVRDFVPGDDGAGRVQQPGRAVHRGPVGTSGPVGGLRGHRARRGVGAARERSPARPPRSRRDSLSSPKYRRKRTERRGRARRTGRPNTNVEMLPKRSNTTAFSVNDSTTERPMMKNRPSVTRAAPMLPYSSDAPLIRDVRYSWLTAWSPVKTTSHQRRAGEHDSGIGRGSGQHERQHDPHRDVDGERGEQRDAADRQAVVVAQLVDPGRHDADRDDEGDRRADGPYRCASTDRQPPRQAAGGGELLAQRPPGDDHADEARRDGRPPRPLWLGQHVVDLVGEAAVDAGLGDRRRGRSPADRNPATPMTNTSIGTKNRKSRNARALPTTDPAEARSRSYQRSPMSTGAWSR